jgi:hypothetical protein
MNGDPVDDQPINCLHIKQVAGFLGVFESTFRNYGRNSKITTYRHPNLIPKIDIPALKPFITSMLTLNNRRPREDSEGLSFKTPEAWLSDPGVRTSYEFMTFDRNKRSKDAAQRLLGVGHKIVNQAMTQAKSLSACVASLPASILRDPLFIFRFYDRVTGVAGPIKTAMIGIRTQIDGNHATTFLRDWELLGELNTISQKQGLKRWKMPPAVDEIDTIKSHVEQARAEAQKRIEELSLPFKMPTEELIAILWPAYKSQPIAEEETRDQDNEDD